MSLSNPSAESALPALRLQPFWLNFSTSRPAPAADALERLSAERLHPHAHGDLPAWTAALSDLPYRAPNKIVLDHPCVGVTSDPPPGDIWQVELGRRLDAFHPWRKGPFCLHGVRIDAEWRSDLKWDRLAAAIAPLDGRLVLDCGCGNGWYGYRCLGAGADLVVGIDPTLRFVLQFLAVNHFIGSDRLAVLPLTDEDLVREPLTGLTGFDTVFSMGVLYHRRAPARHLGILRSLLRPGGELVLETLVLDRPGAMPSSPTAVTPRCAMSTPCRRRRWCWTGSPPPGCGPRGSSTSARPPPSSSARRRGCAFNPWRTSSTPMIRAAPSRGIRRRCAGCFWPGVEAQYRGCRCSARTPRAAPTRAFTRLTNPGLS